MFKSILTIIGVILVADLLGFEMWLFSGQLPQDNFYLGTISAHVYQLVK